MGLPTYNKAIPFLILKCRIDETLSVNVATARYKKHLTRNVKKYREYLLKRQVQGKELLNSVTKPILA